MRTEREGGRAVAARDRPGRVAGQAAALLLAGALAGCASLAPGGPRDGWTALPDSPLEARRAPVAAWLDGRLLVVGGFTDTPCAPTADCVGPTDARTDGAVLDPDDGTWHAIADAPVGLAAASSAVVGDTVFALAPTWNGDPDAEIVHGDPTRRTFVAYDAATDRWEVLAPPPAGADVLVAADDVVVAVGGSDEHRRAVDATYDAEAGEWRALPDDPLGPSFDREAAWLDDRLLLTAKDLVASPGSDGPAVVRMSVLVDWSAWGPPVDTEVIGWGPVAVGERVVFPCTGSADGGTVNRWGRAYPEGGTYDPATGTWTDLPVRRGTVGQVGAWSPLAGLVVDERVVVGDGLLDPVSAEWSPLPAPPWSERYEPAVASGDGHVVVWGGADARTNLADGWLLRVR